MVPALSFIVPVRNDAARLRVALESIHRSADKVGPGEGGRDNTVQIIVIDNGSVDDSVAVARQHGATVIECPTGSVAALRNAAAATATGECLAFVDADNEIAPEWIATAVSVFRDPTFGAAGAHYSPPLNSNWVQATYDRLRHRSDGQHDVEWLGSGNLVIRRQLFSDLGGFDDRLVTCEDVDLCARVRARGLRVVSDSRLGSIHHGDPATLSAVFRGELWRGRDNVRVSLRPPLQWRSLVSLAISCAALAGILLILASPVAGTYRAWVLGGGLGVVAGIILLRACRLWMAGRPTGRPLPDDRQPSIAQALLVAAAYEIGRAVALVIRLPHRRRHATHRAPAHA